MLVNRVHRKAPEAPGHRQRQYVFPIKHCLTSKPDAALIHPHFGAPKRNARPTHWLLVVWC